MADLKNSNSSELDLIISDLNKNEDERDSIGERLKSHFEPIYKKHLENNDFELAKESLRNMPQSTEKIIMFREIIICEEKTNDKKG